MIACARMYAVVPPVAAAWRTLFEWAAVRAGVPLQVIEHAYPAPLDELWTRDDMACAFMCGLPWARAEARPQLVAAPVPVPARYGQQPIYFTDFVVRAESPYRRLEDTFGGRFAYTTETSHSGYNAPRFHLLGFRTARRPALYARVVGPCDTPKRALQAVLDGEADVAPLDSYALDLLRAHAPELVTGIRVLASTAPAPIPPIVASARIDAGVRARLTDALLDAHRAEALSGVMRGLLLARFVDPQPGGYDELVERGRAAEAAGYARIA